MSTRRCTKLLQALLVTMDIQGSYGGVGAGRLVLGELVTKVGWLSRRDVITVTRRFECAAGPNRLNRTRWWVDEMRG